MQRILAVTLCTMVLSATEIELCAPLTTLHEIPTGPDLTLDWTLLDGPTRPQLQPLDEQTMQAELLLPGRYRWQVDARYGKAQARTLIDLQVGALVGERIWQAHEDRLDLPAEAGAARGDADTAWTAQAALPWAQGRAMFADEPARPWARRALERAPGLDFTIELPEGHWSFWVHGRGVGRNAAIWLALGDEPFPRPIALGRQAAWTNRSGRAAMQVELPAGRHRLRIFAHRGRVWLDRIRIQRSNLSAPSATWLDNATPPSLAEPGPATLQVAVAAPDHDAHIEMPTGRRVLGGHLRVPADAPSDLGHGAWVADRHGRWFQRDLGPLSPGSHRLRVGLGAEDPLHSEPGLARWGPEQAAVATRAGLYFYSAQHSRVRIGLHDLHLDHEPNTSRPSAPVLLGLDWDQHMRSGQRWQLRCRVEPRPDNPYDPDEFTLEAEVTRPDGLIETVAAFWYQPMRRRDAGHVEELQDYGPAHFRIRYHPRQGGRHRVALILRDSEGTVQRHSLGDIPGDGPAVDPYVRIDAEDPRFFTVAGEWWWPIGLNIRSVNDLRSQQRLGTRLSPDRGSLAYAAFIDRLAAAGGDAIEVWMSSWNLALEWRAGWPGYHGLGRYHQGHAWRLDQVLDHAASRGVRVLLVLNNHGQAAPRNDREWPENPLSPYRGGPLSEPAEVWSSPEAMHWQDRVRRYVVARWAGHPALMGWKLWSEINLTAGSAEVKRDWHARAGADLARRDPYGHLVTTHWAGSYRSADPLMLALPAISFSTINAYHGNDQFSANLVWQSSQNSERGLARIGQPVLIVEYGGQWSAGAHEVILAGHRGGGWGALVGGLGGSPWLWWWEWVDQHGHWQPYGALRRFIANEDPRGGEAEIPLCEPSALWARTWRTGDRRLGYLTDPDWAQGGGEGQAWEGVVVQLPGEITAGNWVVAWWDADAGRERHRQHLWHPGGTLQLEPPPWRRHLAFKLWRE